MFIFFSFHSTTFSQISVSCLNESCGGLCYTFSTTLPGSKTWTFGDGKNATSSSASITHCYTNVDTHHGYHNTANISVTNGVQPPQNKSITHSNCQHGVFIGDPDGAETNLSTYSAMPGDSFDGDGNTIDVYVYAPIKIDKKFTFSETNIYMKPIAGFNLTLPYNLTLEDGTFVGVKSTCSCQWRGILVNAGSLKTSGNTTIKDATFGIAAYGYVSVGVDIQETNFINNYIGIFAKSTSLKLTFSGNTISTTGTLLDYCSGGISGSPYSISLSNFDDSRTFAGIYFEKVNTISIGTIGGSLNTFEDLANGIILVNSNVGVASTLTTFNRGIANCRFVNIQRGTYSPSIGGYGIFFRATEQGHYMKQTGTGLNNTSTPSFDACEVGVSCIYPPNGNNTNVISQDNRMINMETGYRITNTIGTVRANISNNYISTDQDYGNGTINGNAFAYGIKIFFGAQNSATSIKVNNNVITKDQDAFPFGAAIEVAKSYLDPFTDGIVEITGNDLTIVKQGRGIWALNLSAALIQDNDVTINDYAQSHGIWLNSGNDNNVLCNDIIGPESDELSVQRGLYLGWTDNPIVHDNHITNFNRAFEIEFDCGTADIACNKIIGENDYGIYLNYDAIIGDQIDKGNRFDCNSDDFEAYSSAYLTTGLGYFSAEMGTDAFPDTYGPFGFFVDSDTPTPSCPTETSCDLPFVVAQVTPTDVAIVNGQLTDFPGLNNSAQQSLYRKLMGNPGLVSGDTLMAAFVDEMEDAPIGDFYALRQRIPDLSIIPSSVQSEIEDNLETIGLNLTEMDSFYTPLLYEDEGGWPAYDSLKAIFDSLAESVQMLYEINDSLLEDFQTARLLLADSLIDINETIDAVEIYDVNQQKVFDIFLNTIGKGDTLVTEAQLDTLENIALQCPDEGGRAVYEAIFLYNIFTGDSLEVVECAESRSSNSAPTKPVNGFGLFPNPTNGTCTISYLMKGDQTGKITVLDALGNLVMSKKLDNNASAFRLELLNSGIYFVQLEVDGQLIGTQKLIKL